MALTSSGVGAVIVLFALEVLALDSAGFGVLLAVAAFGGVAGSLLAARIVERWGRRRTLLGSVGLGGTGFAVLGLVSEPVAAAILYLLTSATVAIWNTVTMSMRQTLIPGELFGRVLGAYRVVVYGAVAVGAAVGGLVADATTLRAPFLVAAVGHVLVFIYAARSLQPEALADRPELGTST